MTKTLQCIWTVIEMFIFLNFALLELAPNSNLSINKLFQMVAIALDKKLNLV